MPVPTLTMKLVSYHDGGKVRLGALLAGRKRIADLSRARREYLHSKAAAARSRTSAKTLPAEMIAFLQGGDAAMDAARETLRWVERELRAGRSRSLADKRAVVAAGEVRLAAPVPRPPKLIAVWVNYHEHGKEASVNAPQKAPLFFTKFPTAVIGPGDAIVLPRISHKVDYEAELAFVIGKRGKDIARAKAYDHIDRKSTRLNSSHIQKSRMPSSA